ncbi:MAG: secondary thiamine-phosphate synthase enzyme YjbQ [Thermoplasmata archaeon]
MSVYGEDIEIQTEEGEIVDITGNVNKAVSKSKIKNGIVCAFTPGSTGAITTIEYEDGLLADLSEAVERIFPKKMGYKHNARWGDGNGHSHVRASMIGPGITIPLRNGAMTLGTWQQIVFLELDNRARRRRIVVQVVGE